ncbi:hypothetical protein Q5H92_08520 [Hymenobacter sp. M29]|uniref:Uncharacterized protein n=1 Tax=Hymenobacter mellowenesis TaxID=3063995 RepID=A0ABT9ACE3_9BACT|nr:hypothetical protein [Hymenobacter sp. M29]MDO7846397.1 hypothetical protein [Hymenobacter sp. M29]
MKKMLLNAGLLLSIGFRAHAQQPAGPEAMHVHADTVRAVHRLFGQHRTGGYIWSAIGAAFAVRIATAAASSDSGASGGGIATGVAVFGGVPAAIGVGKLVRFSGGREETVIQAYEQGKALPRYVVKRLKRQKYFAQ